MTKKLSFEQAYHELERVVARMEEGAASLEEALVLYERGVALSQHCTSLLDRAELRVVKLRERNDGQVEQIPFDF